MSRDSVYEYRAPLVHVLQEQQRIIPTDSFPSLDGLTKSIATDMRKNEQASYLKTNTRKQETQ